MRASLAFLVLVSMSFPVFAQAQADDQDHSAHHPPGVEGTVAPVVVPPINPAGTVNLVTSSSGGCSMMPDMMQSMMKGMMQGMMNSREAAMGSGQGMSSSPAMSRMAEKNSAAMSGQNSAVSSKSADLSLVAITQHALIERTKNALSVQENVGDAEFARITVVLQDALVDVAKAAAAFGNTPETRQRAQAIVAKSETELISLRAWADTLK
jgi:hypothetical protein